MVRFSLSLGSINLFLFIHLFCIYLTLILWFVLCFDEIDQLIYQILRSVALLLLLLLLLLAVIKINILN
jgi:hypothetical protein